MHNLNVVCSQNKLDISRVPLVRELIGTPTYMFAPRIQPSAVLKVLHKHPSQASKTSKADPSKTFLTPIVNQIAEKLFEGSLEVAETLQDDSLQQKQVPVHHQKHPFNPASTIWGQEIGGGIYNSVNIDGIVYSVSLLVIFYFAIF